MKSQRRELKLERCARPWSRLRFLSSIDLKSEPLTAVAEAYERNLLRVYSLTVFPSAVVNAVRRVTQITTHLNAQHAQALKSGEMSKAQLVEAISQRIDEDASKREGKLAEAGKAGKGSLLLQNELATGFVVLNSILSTHLQHAADAWMSAQITGTWTAFESLAEDLWVAALNVHPHGLSSLGEKAVPFERLQQFGFDLSKNMGNLLKGKFKFQRLMGIREAYTGAFGDAKINEIMHRTSLDALSAVRNVIIHNGAIVDEDFLKMRSHLPPTMAVGLGDSIRLDGELVETLVEPVMNWGWELLIAVDEWLVSH